MAINKAMRLALKALSYPDLDLKKIYKIERMAKSIKAPHLLKPLYQSLNRTIVADGREVLIRIFNPVERRSNHILLFFHGGGWVTESVDTYNKVCVSLAKNIKCRVISVEYSLAPEFPFPEGLLDCYAVAKEYITHAAAYGTTAENIILIGDSAGGNLSAAIALMARDRKEFSVYKQILLYPATGNDHTEASPFPSIRENGTDYLLTSKRIQEYTELYIANPKDFQNPYFAPLLATDYTNLPETLLITAEYDPLRDEGEEYGKRLKEAENKVYSYRMPDALHGYFSLDESFELVKSTYDLIKKFVWGELDLCQSEEIEPGED